MSVLIIIIVTLLMEPLTAITHRIIMHKHIWIWHKSHHERYAGKFELNDLFPIVFSLIAIGLFLAGTKYDYFTPVAIGITIYGATYFVVHEIIIHSRFMRIKSNNPLFNYWRFSHNVHHQFHKEPYGFIVPVTPKDLKEKAKNNPRDLIDRFNSKTTAG
ncbi:MAG: hypothetical protein U0R17_00340 [Acidimicrobiia bacterium]